MHELSIAMSIIELAEEEAERRQCRVSAVHLRLGALSGVLKDALTSSYEIACENTRVAGSKLIVEDVPIIVFCESCQADRTLTSMQWFCCPECGTPTFKVVQGKELEVIALEIQ